MRKRQRFATHLVCVCIYTLLWYVYSVCVFIIEVSFDSGQCATGSISQQAATAPVQ